MEEKTKITQQKNDVLEPSENDTEVIKAIKEGFKEKVKALEEKHKKDLEEQEKKLEEKHAKQIRDLFLTGTDDVSSGSGKQQKDDDDKELSFFEQIEKATKEKLKI